MQTNILNKFIARKDVQTEQSPDCHNYVGIEKIEYIGEEDVYNMEVKNHHNFSVCGGFIVHNCIDAVRYGMEDVFTLRKAKIKKKASIGAH